MLSRHRFIAPAMHHFNIGHATGQASGLAKVKW